MLSMTWSLVAFFGWCSGHQRASWLIPNRRQKSRWPDPHSLTERQVIMLGRQLTDSGVIRAVTRQGVRQHSLLLLASWISMPCVSSNLLQLKHWASSILQLSSCQSCHLLNDLGRRKTVNSDEARETGFLYQLISVLIERYTAVFLRDDHGLTYNFFLTFP